MYAQLDSTQEVPLVKDFEVDDVGDTDEFLAWWQVEIEGDVGEEVGLRLNQQVDEPGIIAQVREIVDDEPIGDHVEE